MPRHNGVPNKVKSTPAIRALWKYFIRRFINEYTLPPDEKNHEGGVEAFFGLPDRRVVFCRAVEEFTIPGSCWASLSEPHKLIPGLTDRKLTRKSAFVLRVDARTPNRAEIEHKGRVFVLTMAQVDAIKDKFKVIA